MRRFKYRLADTLAYLLVGFVIGIPWAVMALIIYLIIRIW